MEAVHLPQAKLLLAVANLLKAGVITQPESLTLKGKFSQICLSLTKINRYDFRR